MAALSFLAYSKSPIFNPDHNPLLRFLLKKSFYAQFCAGETPAEIRRTIDSLQNMGYKGVILGYAKEVVLEGNDVSTLDTATDCTEQEKCNATDVTAWEKGTLQTVELCKKDDFVALKFTGAGRQALQHLSKTIPCAPQLEEAVHKICRLARQRGVRLLFDAEQASLQDGIDNWTMYFMKHYNKAGTALVYGTYPAYAKKTPKVLATHLEMAKKENFVLGIKLVRGAYMGSDPRELFWPTIEDTHKCYNGITEAVLRRSYNDVLPAIDGSAGEFPHVDFMLASHNAKSVEHARKIRDEQARAGTERIEFAYGQLMGMADNVSTKLVQVAKERRDLRGGAELDIPRAYKYLVWGSVAECSKYLLRRAQENQDAVSRTVDARQALGREVARRMGFVR
jgi:proline dehydrogenase